MKKTLSVVMAVAVLGIAAVALAHGPGYGGHMGYGGYMMGPGYGGYMMGPGYGGDTETREFLEKTADIRRELNQKRFEYTEAVRAGDEKKADALADDIEKLSEKLYKEAPRSIARGYGRGCW